MKKFESIVMTTSFDNCFLIKMDRGRSLFWSWYMFSEIEIIFVIIKNEISWLAFVVRLIDIGGTIGVEAVEIQNSWEYRV